MLGKPPVRYEPERALVYRLDAYGCLRSRRSRCARPHERSLALPVLGPEPPGLRPSAARPAAGRGVRRRAARSRWSMAARRAHGRGTGRASWCNCRRSPRRTAISAISSTPRAAPFDDRAARRTATYAACDLLAMQPHVVMTEMFPFGRRAFRGELLPLLEAASAPRPRPLVLASVRDVLVSKPDPARYRWMVEACLRPLRPGAGPWRRAPDAVRRLSFPLAAELGDRVVHTGFVHPAHRRRRRGPAPAVLVSAGGGAVGERLLRAALAARPLHRATPRPLASGRRAQPAGRDIRCPRGAGARRLRDGALPAGSGDADGALRGVRLAGGLQHRGRGAGGGRADGAGAVRRRRGGRADAPRRAAGALGVAERVGEAEVDAGAGGRDRPDRRAAAARSRRLVLRRCRALGRDRGAPWCEERFGDA